MRKGIIQSFAVDKANPRQLSAVKDCEGNFAYTHKHKTISSISALGYDIGKYKLIYKEDLHYGFRIINQKIKRGYYRAEFSCNIKLFCG